MTVREIVKEWLAAHGYGGLTYCGDWEGCGCGLDDLIACGEACDHCQPAYRVTWDTCQWRLEEGGCQNGYTTAPCFGCYSTEEPKAVGDE